MPSAAQIRTVPSSPPVASQVPSGAIATAPTQPSWPVRVARGVPSAAQVRTVPSSPPVASQVPSGAIATACTGPSWPVRTRISASEGRSGGGQDGQAVQARRPDRSAGSWLASSGIPPSLLVKVVITAAGRLGRAQQVSVLRDHAPQPPGGRRARAGQVGFDGRRTGAPQPDRQEPQITAHLIQLRAQARGLQVVGEVLPQVPATGCLRQPPPRRPAALPVARQRCRRPHRVRSPAGLR